MAPEESDGDGLKKPFVVEAYLPTYGAWVFDSRYSKLQLAREAAAKLRRENAPLRFRIVEIVKKVVR